MDFGTFPRSAPGRHVCAAWLAATLLWCAGCAAVPSAPLPAENASALGIQVQGLNLSAHDHVLDLRYRVLDAAKAAPLLNARSKIVLLDPARNARLGIPQSPVIGGMRQTSRNRVVYTDRDYFILFMNPGRAVQPGDRLQLLVDDTPVAELTVGGRRVP